MGILFALCILGFMVVGAIYSLKSYNPNSDFTTWCTDVQLLLHDKGFIQEANLFISGDWIDAWYRGETPEQAINNKYGHDK